jgi:excisionase family DNA binding protein
MSPRQPQPTRAIYVRIPVPEAEKLDRAAERLNASKRDVIATLLADHLDPDGGDVFVGPGATPRRIVFEDEPDQMVVGHAAFTPAPPAEVLTLEEAAELLRVEPDALRGLAERGELPARRVDDDWRFRREALLDWLGAS